MVYLYSYMKTHGFPPYKSTKSRWFGAHSPVVWDPTSRTWCCPPIPSWGTGMSWRFVGNASNEGFLSWGKNETNWKYDVEQTSHGKHEKKRWTSFKRMQLVGCNQRSNNRATLDNIYIQCKLILWLTAVVWVRISPSALRIWILDKPLRLGGEYQGFRGQCRNPMNDENPLDLFHSSLWC